MTIVDRSTAELVKLPTVQPGARKRSGFRVPRGIERLAGVVVLFALWELAARVGWLSPNILAGPSAALTAGWDMLRDGRLTEAIWASLQRVTWGLAIGIPIGPRRAQAPRADPPGGSGAWQTDGALALRIGPLPAGESRLVRQADGVHFTFTGGNVFAPQIWPAIAALGRQQMAQAVHG